MSSRALKLRCEVGRLCPDHFVSSPPAPLAERDIASGLWGLSSGTRNGETLRDMRKPRAFHLVWLGFFFPGVHTLLPQATGHVSERWTQQSTELRNHPTVKTAHDMGGK